MDNQFRDIVLENSDVITKRWIQEVEALRLENYTDQISDRLLDSTNREFVNVIFHSIRNEGETAEVRAFSEKLIHLGWPLSYITDGLHVFRRVIIECILTELRKEESTFVFSVLNSADQWVEPIIRHLVNEYSGNWEHTVSLQRVALQELSAPLIPVMDGITVMPLVGTIDTERAKLIMENLLDGVMKHNAEVVLMDITGVPVVDTMVAHHIIQAVEAVRIIGSTCILVGIRPEIAQTIVSLGIDLAEYPTKSSLKKGFTAALELTNRKIVQTKEEEVSIDELIKSLHKE